MWFQREGFIPLVLREGKMSIQVNEFDYQVLHLSRLFYSDYPNPPYKEMLMKDKRAYNCLLIQSCYGYFICIPYRSQISHKYAFMFKKSIRSRTHKSGLDYTKIVIIQNKDYLDDSQALVDKDEYNETRTNINRIQQEAQEFVDDYITYMKGNEKISKEEFKRRYRFSTLKYFHKELGIRKTDIGINT